MARGKWMDSMGALLEDLQGQIGDRSLWRTSIYVVVKNQHDLISKWKSYNNVLAVLLRSRSLNNF